MNASRSPALVPIDINSGDRANQAMYHCSMPGADSPRTPPHKAVSKYEPTTFLDGIDVAFFDAFPFLVVGSVMVGIRSPPCQLSLKKISEPTLYYWQRDRFQLSRDFRRSSWWN